MGDHPGSSFFCTLVADFNIPEMIKRATRFFLWIPVLLLMLFSCVKGYEPEPDPIFPVNNFTGQWKGSLPYSSSGPVSEILISLATYNKNTSLTGYMSTPDGIMIMDAKQFFNGMYLFTLRKNNNCQNWNVGGSSYLITTTSMGLNFGGTFCEEHPRDIEGTMARINPSPDTTVLLTLAAAGRHWAYDITDSTGMTFRMNKEMESELGNGVWRERTTFINGKSSSVSLQYLYITPVEYGELPVNDSLYADRMITYAIDSRPGTTYIQVTPEDSIITRVITKNVQVTVPAGTFRCIKMTKKYIALNAEGINADVETWFNTNVGTIKTVQYEGDSIIMTQVLMEKSW